MSFKFFNIIFIGLLASHALILTAQDNPFADDNRLKRTMLEIQLLEDRERDNTYYEIENFKRTAPISQIVQLIVDGKGRFEDAEMSADQQQRIRKIHADYLGRFRKLLGDKVVGNRLDMVIEKVDRKLLQRDGRIKFDEFRDKFTNEILAVFLPQQLKGFANTGLIAGVPKIVTESSISEVLDVSDEQKRKIQIESNKLAKEIEEFCHKTRLKAAQITMNNLTEKQKEQLFDIYGQQKIQRQFSMISIRMLFRQLSFTEKPPKGSIVLPKGKNVDWTDVNDAMKKN